MSGYSTSHRLYYFNGINGANGEYALPPISGEELSRFITGESPPENLSELRFRHQHRTGQHLGVKEGVDPARLEEAGWGVIFPYNANPAIKEALGELLELRCQQAGQYFKIYAGTDKQGGGYRPNESKNEFLARNGAGPGPADPERVPYYLLIVGSPQEIPYRFQTQLDVQYSVGRVYFDTLDEYASYARSAVAAETGEVKLARQAAFFSPSNPDDVATRLSTEALVGPLANKFAANKADWQVNAYLSDKATKAQLGGLLGGAQTPAVLFTANHGMCLPAGDAGQLSRQGALICQDWPGPKAWNGKGAIPEEFYFAGDDLAPDANLSGLVAFFFACFGAGTPHQDEYSKWFLNDQAEAIAPYPFLSRLPVKMLGHPGGGALAVVGHVERAWSFSFDWPEAGAQLAVFESTLQRLLDGHRVGSACEYFNERYAELSTVLSDELEEIEFNKKVDPYRLAGLWTANNDARGYAILGDPAVRLPVVQQGEEPQRPQIQAGQITAEPRVEAHSDAGQLDEKDQVLPGDSGPSREEPAGRSSPEQTYKDYSPLPSVRRGYKDEHPELYNSWVRHIEAGYKQNDEVFRRILEAFMRSHQSTLIMYWTLFAVGIGFFVTAVVLALAGGAPLPATIFGGLSVISFLTYFISRPTQSIEENLLYITWLGVIYNSYWTNLAWSFDEKAAHQVLDEATQDALTQIQTLIDHHNRSTSRRPGLWKRESDSGKPENDG